MARAIELVGDRLLALPDGEIGERSDQYPSGNRSQWVAGLAGRLAREPSLFDVLDVGTMNEQGFPVDFDSTARLRPRLGPKSHTLAYVHLPFAAGASPPPAEPRAYRALQNLDLPANARLVAGFVHEQLPVERLEELLRIIEKARSDEVDIACACGLGRRSTDTAEELMRRCRQLSGGSPATEQGD